MRFRVELELGKYIAFEGQLSNADNQDVIARGITQTNLSSHYLQAKRYFCRNGRFGSICKRQRLGVDQRGPHYALHLLLEPEMFLKQIMPEDQQCLVSCHDGDTSNYVDRFPNFLVSYRNCLYNRIHRIKSRDDFHMLGYVM